MVTNTPREIEAFANAHPERVKKTESVECDRRTCRAKPGQRCRTPSGVVTMWHLVRKQKAGTVDRMGNWL